MSISLCDCDSFTDQPSRTLTAVAKDRTEHAALENEVVILSRTPLSGQTMPCWTAFRWLVLMVSYTEFCTSEWSPQWQISAAATPAIHMQCYLYHLREAEIELVGPPKAPDTSSACNVD